MMVQWKHLQPGGYVCGLEPSMWYGHGRAAARAREALRFLEPGDAITNVIVLAVEALNS